MVNAAVCMMVLAATVAPTLEAATMVARPDAKSWESPAFRGRPFWPVFEKMSHKDDSPYTNRLGAASSLALEDLPLTREYASSIVAHYYKAGVAKYRRVFFRLGICYTTKANRTTGEDK